MKKDDFYEEDDGRTIADMSGIERQPTFLPHFHRKRSDFSAPDAPAMPPSAARSRRDC